MLTPSHFYPLVPLAWSLRAAGHEVVVAHPPVLSGYVRESGLPSMVLGSDVVVGKELQQRLMSGARPAAPTGTGRADSTLAHTAFTLRLFVAGAAHMTGELIEFARNWRPDLIVYESQCHAGHIASRVLDVPAARHLVGPDHSIGADWWHELERDSLQPVYDRFDAGSFGATDVLTIDPCPTVLQLERHPGTRYVPSRYVPYNGTGQVADWMFQPRRRPRVAITVGGTYSVAAKDLAPIVRIVQALDSDDHELVVAVPTGTTHHLGAWADRVRPLENVPLSSFLTGCDALVSHGGDGTVSTAIAAGVPQVLTPVALSGHPAYHNAERMVGAGAAVYVEDHEQSAEGMREAVAAVLADSVFREAAAELRADNEARPNPTAVIAELSEWAKR